MTHTFILRTLVVLALLFGLTGIQCLADESENGDTSLNSLKFSQGIWDAANYGMGLKRIQETFDKYGQFRSHVPDRTLVTAKLANITGERFGNFTVALTRLRLAIEAHYDRSDDNVNIPMCCNLTGAKFQKAFRTKVDAHQLCTRVSTDAEPNLDLPGEGFLREARKNSQGYPYIKWQYFGTEEGGLRLYPAFQVGCNFSPRVRPWYVETFAPEPKDIVIVVDGTSHAGDDLVKRSVFTIIDTTNPNDRIGVVRFGESASTPVGSEKTSTCYKTTLALATPVNKDYLKSYVSQTGRTDGAAKYIPALRKAFSLLSNTDDTAPNRRQVLLFFTHSDPQDALPEGTKTLVMGQMVDNMSRNNTRLTILTYVAGNDIQPRTEELLQTLSNLSFSGSYTRLTSTSNLRYNLRSYYSTLSHPLEHSLFVLPYIDGWGLGLIISICQPFFVKTKFQGVVCIDGTLGDLLSDVINIREGVGAYSFIVDNQGRTIHHPYLAQPNDDQKSNLNVHISMLERSVGPETKEIIAEITQGKPGGRSIRVPLPTAKATFPGQWVQRHHVTKHYEWTKIPNTNYTLCIVSMGNDVETNLTVPKQTPRNYLNAHRIADSNPCMHEGLTSTIDKSTVNLDDKTLYKDCEDESEDDKALILTVYFTSEKSKHYCIKDYVHDEVLLTGQADSVWKSAESSKYNGVIMWRHLMTLGGVRRIYPGVHYHLHTPLILPWYVKALSDVNTIILTRSNVSNRIVITMSHVVYEGRTSGVHTHHNLPVAVLAAEFRYSYIMDMVLGLMPSCQMDAYSCLLVDESGLVLLHTDVGEDQHDTLGHVLDMEPTLAKRLISRGYLTSGNCTNVEHLRIQTFWRISTPGVSVTDTYFEMQVIAETNTFIILLDKGSSNDGNTCPPCLNSGDILPCKNCDNTNTECNCPCYCHLQFDYCNYTFATIEPFTCPLSVLPMSVEKDDFPHQAQYPTCYKTTACTQAKSENDCFLLPGCTWCMDKEEEEYTCLVKNQCRKSESGGSKTAVIVVVLLLVLACAAIAIVCFLRSRGYTCLWCRKCPLWPKSRDEEVYHNISDVVSMQSEKEGSRAPAVPPSGAHRWAPKGVENMAYCKDERAPSVCDLHDNYYSNAMSVKEPSKSKVVLSENEPPLESTPTKVISSPRRDTGLEHVSSPRRDTGVDHVSSSRRDTGVDNISSPRRDTGVDHVSSPRRDTGVDNVKRRPPPIPSFPSSYQSNQPDNLNPIDASKINLRGTKSAEPRPNLKATVRPSFSNPYLTTPAEVELKEQAEEEANCSQTQDTKPSEGPPTVFVPDNGLEFRKDDVVDFNKTEPADYLSLCPVDVNQSKLKRMDAMEVKIPLEEGSDSDAAEMSGSAGDLKRQDPDGKDDDFLYLPMSTRYPIISDDSKLESPSDDLG